jgi:hypothetical protein
MNYNNAVYLLRISVIKASAPALPLLAMVLSLDDTSAYKISSLSVAIQNFVQIVMFGGIAAFSVKQGRAISKAKIEKNALNFGLFCYTNSILLMIFLIAFDEYTILNSTAVVIAIITIVWHIDSISKYAAAEVKAVPNGLHRDALMALVMIFSIGSLLDEKLSQHVVMWLPIIFATLVFCKILNKAKKNGLGILFRGWQKWLLYIKSNYIIFVISYITPLSLFTVGRVIERNQSAMSYVEFIQTYSLFAMLVFPSNIYVQKLLVDYGRSEGWRIVFAYAAKGLMIPVLLLSSYVIAVRCGIVDKQYLNSEVTLWMCSTAFVFLIQSIGSQVLFIKNKILPILIFNAAWLLILTAMVFFAATTSDVWRSYFMSMLIIGCIQFLYLWIKKCSN